MRAHDYTTRLTKATAEIETPFEDTLYLKRPTHGSSVAIALTALATEVCTVATDSIPGAATKVIRVLSSLILSHVL